MSAPKPKDLEAMWRRTEREARRIVDTMLALGTGAAERDADEGIRLAALLLAGDVLRSLGRARLRVAGLDDEAIETLEGATRRAARKITVAMMARGDA